eukprot:TRINITY_DN41153_c0_g1_i5.p1 TRINITY_DN41153_c0_g1~~TRINITY_DN41153_c0_g1_i5.p1  ORF type:complete len:638 (+),score=74.30 TRINITY_DN41153_c0_g1_i5:57-1916(+)
MYKEVVNENIQENEQVVSTQQYEQEQKNDNDVQQQSEEAVSRNAVDRNTVISAAASNSPESTALHATNANADSFVNQIDLLNEGSHRSVREFEDSNNVDQDQEFEISNNVVERMQSGNESRNQLEVGVNVGVQEQQQQDSLSMQKEDTKENTQSGSLDAYMGMEGTYIENANREESQLEENSIQQSMQQQTVIQEVSRRSSTASSPFLHPQEVNEQTSSYAEQSNGHQAISYTNMPQILESDVDETNTLPQQQTRSTTSTLSQYEWGQSLTDRGGSMELGMHESCPLYDENLPMSMETLMMRQITMYVAKLREMFSEFNSNENLLESVVLIEQLLHVLEVLARLGWSDDSFRQAIVQGGGLECAVGLMKKAWEFEGIQCAVCLFLMAMVRGDSEICQANQWRVARENGVETIVGAMKMYRNSRMVQLSCLLTLVPLAIENIMMQAHIARTARDELIRTIQINQDDAEIVSKGLLALGVLLQGNDVVHDAIRLEMYEQGVLSLLAHVISLHPDNEDLLWSCVFMSALMLKPNSAYFTRIGRRAVVCGLFGSLKERLLSYIRTKDEDIDEVIVTSGTALLNDLVPLYENYLMIRGTIYGVSTGLAAFFIGWLVFKRLRWKQ